MKHNNEIQERGRILVVDDDLFLLAAIEQTLTLHNFCVDTFDTPLQSLDAVKVTDYAAVLTDVKMPLMDGLELLERIKNIDPELPVIVITGHGDVTMAVTAMQKGAYDFLQKPVDEDMLIASLGRAVEKRQLVLENRELSANLLEQRKKRTRFHGIVGNHPVMQQLYDTLEKVATESDPVMLYGETGTGKELVALAIHEIATRSEEPFVAVNMGAIPSEMLESELFGHVKGAFTGADRKKTGKFIHAGKGTILLDEINSLPVALQGKLLRVLEEKEITPLGSNDSIPIRARIIVATNKNLIDEVSEGRFREDLYFRLNVLPINIPPLRERSTDIPLLVKCFHQEYCHERQLDVKLFDQKTLLSLQKKKWPGNVRELKNHVRRMCILGEQSCSEEFSHQCEKEYLQGIEEKVVLKEFLAQMEKKYIMEVLKRNRGQITLSYTDLGISRKSLYDKVKKYELDLIFFRNSSES